MGIEMPPNSLETLQALTKALPGKRAAAGGPLPLNRREASNPWDNVPDQPLVRYRYRFNIIRNDLVPVTCKVPYTGAVSFS
jgi:hypothetical protein